MGFTKDFGATLDYTVNWSAWLDTDTIAAGTSGSAWTVSSTSTDITIVSHSKTTTTTIVWLSGGTVGERYELTNQIETDAARIDDRTLVVTVVDK
jgi:hypothetical protein